jgi:hypothetical protein
VNGGHVAGRFGQGRKLKQHWKIKEGKLKKYEQNDAASHPLFWLCSLL